MTSFAEFPEGSDGGVGTPDCSSAPTLSPSLLLHLLSLVLSILHVLQMVKFILRNKKNRRSRGHFHFLHKLTLWMRPRPTPGRVPSLHPSLAGKQRKKSCARVLKFASEEDKQQL